MSNSMGGLKVDNKVHERLKKLAEAICREELKISKGIPFTCEDHRIAFLNRCLEGRDTAIKVIEKGVEELKKAGAEIPDLSVETESKEKTTVQSVTEFVVECFKTVEYMVGYGMQAVKHADLRAKYMHEVRITSQNWFNRIIELEKEKDVTKKLKETEILVKEMMIYRRCVRMKYIGMADESIKRIATAKLEELGSLDNVLKSRSTELFKKDFNQLDDFQKMKVYDKVLEDAGQSSRLYDVAGDVGNAKMARSWLLKLTFLISLHDVYCSEDKIKTAVGELSGFLAGNYVGGTVGEVVPGLVIRFIETAAAVEFTGPLAAVLGFGLLVSNLGVGYLYGQKADWVVTKLYESAVSNSGGVFEGKTRTQNPFYMAGAGENGYNIARTLNF